MCTFCGIKKDETEYYTYLSGPRKGKKWSQCKPCRSRQLQEWREKDPKKYSLQNRRARLKSKYGLTIEEVPLEGECPICLNNKKLVVDHCHTEGHVRGFICHNCNTLLGHIENNDKMERVRKYLSQKREADNGPI